MLVFSLSVAISHSSFISATRVKPQMELNMTNELGAVQGRKAVNHDLFHSFYFYSVHDEMMKEVDK